MPIFADLPAMQARFEERDLRELSDDDNSGTLDVARINLALESADALIVSYIAARHKDAAAFAGNAILTDVACDYAFARLYRSNMPDWVAERRKGVIRTLTDIAAGKIKLDGGEEIAAPRPDAINIHSDRQNFGRDNLGGY